MKWEGISEFVYVAEYQSFTQAAKQLGISIAQVSRQVSALEKRLNIKLFYRTTRKISLTEEGRLFYNHCRDILDRLDAAEHAISDLQAKPQGKIKLTAPVTYGEQQLLPLINDFMVLYPDVEVIAFLSNQTLDLIEGGYDLAIRIGKLDDSSLMAKKLSHRTSYVCASPAYLDKYGTPESLAQLADHNCLLGSLDHWRFKVGDAQRSIRVTGRVHYNSGHSLVDAALKGLGMVQLPDYYVQQYLDSGALISLLDAYREPEEGIWAVYPYNRQLTTKVKVLLQYLQQHL
ncbi:LysR family transcriptional regulator [Psychrobacter sp. FDAARGOS_221]|uniref:LysR family transcriptional regulator n=1 Tax=Psychrobacter sp. FDAARGOS_221 TaxID=1975705 RepID=UPI000BB54527|nr:LysR family transcriptional regulator [Psychrobacter sp. FDAARGOS_221]PNK59706.1 LysR family transcriptional regulator [Psychrobacter sp. FDAARGOS_221]